MGVGFFIALFFFAPTLFAQDAFKDYVDKHQSEPIAIDYDFGSKSYALRGFSADRLREVLEIQGERLENRYFKVVENMSEAVLPTTDLDGRNALYHLMRALKYFGRFSPGNAAFQNKIIVRVRVTRLYNAFTHFAEWERFNDARYIPKHWGGAWGNEIWFHACRSKVNWKQIGIDVGLSALARSPWSLLTTPYSFLTNRFGGLDSAKTPSIVYHEAFHWATDAPEMLLTRPKASEILEDYANYFAAAISGKPQVGELPGYNDGEVIRDLSRIREMRKPLKKDDFSGHPFVPSLLWSLRSTLGEGRTDELVWNSLAHVRRESAPSETANAVLRALPSIHATAEETAYVTKRFEDFRRSFENLDKTFFQ